MSAKYWKRLSFECGLWEKGVTYVAGVDEAGCGPLAGPVVAAAVLFPCAWLASGIPGRFRGLNDSKQLTEPEREKFYARITTHPEVRFGIASVDPEMIDQINILQAAHRAMQLALDQLNPAAEHVLVDGRPVRSLKVPHTPLTKGDCRSYSIAAASVLAKVTRDRMMVELDGRYPGYEFAGHKGYGTPQHLVLLAQLGPSPIHRRSFSPCRPAELDLFDDPPSGLAAATNPEQKGSVPPAV
jgi:ribonuclease HII